MRKMSVAAAVAALDALPGGDPEVDHSEADAILLRSVAPEVAAAYMRLRDERCRWWAFS